MATVDELDQGIVHLFFSAIVKKDHNLTTSFNSVLQLYKRATKQVYLAQTLIRAPKSRYDTQT